MRLALQTMCWKSETVWKLTTSTNPWSNGHVETPYTLSLCSNFDTMRPLSEIDWSQVILDTSRKYWITSDCFHSEWHFKSFQYISSICKCNKYSFVCKPFPSSSDWGQEDSSAERQLRRTPQEYVEKMCGALWDGLRPDEDPFVSRRFLHPGWGRGFRIATSYLGRCSLTDVVWEILIYPGSWRPRRFSDFTSETSPSFPETCFDNSDLL